MTGEPLSVTEEQLFAIIGRLHVENMLLRARLSELEQLLAVRPEAMPPMPASIHAMPSEPEE